MYCTCCSVVENKPNHQHYRYTTELLTSNDDFPTPESLREANNKYKQKTPGKHENGRVVPSPAVSTKQQVFKLSDYKAIDDRASQVSTTLYDRPLNDLVSYLIKPAKSELGKARAIFRWIVAQNLTELNGGEANVSNPHQTPLDYLLGMKNDTISYHTLMNDMCRCAGVETAQVEGFVKHAEYQPGDDVRNAKFEGSWTAILISGTWHLTNVRWSSKKVTGVDSGEWELLDDNGNEAVEVKKQKRESLYYEYDEFYFLTDPEQFIYFHFPKDPKWQLLARQVSLEEFTQMAKLESHFFEYRLRMKTHKRCVESAPEGVIKIELEVPADKDYEFIYRLWISKNRKENAASYKDKKLKQFVFMECRDGTLSCTIEFPLSGKFKLELFCTDKAVSDTYFPVCAYVINVEKAKENARAYPDNSRSQWGPGYDLEAAGLKPISHKDGIIHQDRGEIEMLFSVEKDVDVLPKVHSDTITADNMNGFVIYRVENKKFILNIKFPEAGDYALNLYAKGKGNDENDNLPNVCSYLISLDKAVAEGSPFFAPGKFNGQLGARDKFDVLRMKAVSQPLAYIEDPRINGQMDFTVDTPVPCDLFAELILCRDKKEQNMEGFVFTVQGMDNVTVKARFPEKGNYMLKLYGKEKGKDGSYSLLFVYFIIVHEPMSNCCRFQKTYARGPESCELLQPDIGIPLYVDKITPFIVTVPEADDVVVIHPTAGTTRLTKDDKETWRGDVYTGNEAGLDILLCASFSMDSNSYIVLREFKVMKPESDATVSSSSQCEVNQTESRDENGEGSRQDEDKTNQEKCGKEQQQREQGQKNERQKGAEISQRREKQEKDDKLWTARSEQEKTKNESEQEQINRQNKCTEKEKRKQRRNKEEIRQEQKIEEERQKREKRKENERQKRDEKRERETEEREKEIKRRELEDEWKKQFREQELRREMGEFEWRRQQAKSRNLAIDNLFGKEAKC